MNNLLIHNSLRWLITCSCATNLHVNYHVMHVDISMLSLHLPTSDANNESSTGMCTTIRELSSKFEEFLAARSKFDTDHGVDFYAPTCFQSATFVRSLFSFYCPLFFTEKNNVAKSTRCLRCATDGSA